MSIYINTLFGTGQVVDIAVGETYTVKADEVFINNHPYKKKDLEIKMSNNDTNADPLNVKVGIRLRDGVKTLPASMVSYSKWEINGASQSDLASLVENINATLE